MTNYVPFLAISFVLWNFILASINDASLSYVQAERLLKQTPLPMYFPLVRSFTKNAVIFFHNSIIMILALIIFGVGAKPVLFLVVPGLVVLMANLYWLGTIVAIASTRYRDLPPIVTSFFMLSFYVTPILWQPEDLPESFRRIVVNFNPFFHLMELVRAPLLGFSPSLLNWMVTIGLLLGGSVVARVVYIRFSPRINYWL